MEREIELAWAAGFFDGEGTITLTGRRAVRHHNFMVAIKQSVGSDAAVPDVLARFQAAVGAGKIGGPYIDRPTRQGFSPNRRPSFTWYAIDAEADLVLARLWPQLGSVKRAQAARVREAHRAA